MYIPGLRGRLRPEREALLNNSCIYKSLSLSLYIYIYVRTYTYT